VKKKKNIDVFFVTIVMLILLIGLVSVYSSSYIEAGEKFSDPGYFLKKQATWAIIGIVAMFLISTIDYHFFIRNSRGFLFFFFILLVIILFLPDDSRVKGANRWISLRYFKVQPSEFVKFIFVWYLAFFFGKSENIVNIKKKIFNPLFIFISLAVVILLQPDLGTVFVFAFTFIVILFILGLQYSYLFIIIFSGLICFISAIYIKPYRRNRILAFIDPWAYRYDLGYHIINSLIAVGSGGLSGLGLGASRQKYLYLPEPYTDFIFAIICEETGFLGATVILLLFSALFLRGWYIVRKAPDISGFILGLGIITTITVQALINMGVVLNLFPTKGLPLPFISYGGSSLLILFINTGIILNISRSRNEKD
jgi:cell division protein FtsW